MSERDGPEVILRASCRGCNHQLNVLGALEGEPSDYYCLHPEGPDFEIYGRTVYKWGTPAWCPFLRSALEQKIEEEISEIANCRHCGCAIFNHTSKWVSRCPKCNYYV